MVLDIVSRDPRVVRAAKTKADIARLWDCCQIPDYRKLSPSAHAELALSVFGFIVRAGYIPDDWFARHVAVQDRVDGGLDTLAARIAEVRTWTFIANRSNWLRDPEHWQSVTRRVEDRLSDALHERLAQRFVDRRTSVLMRRLRENAMLEAEVTPSGDVVVEGQHVGQLIGFRFTADTEADGEAAKTLNAAAQKALASEFEGRALRLNEAVDDAFVLSNDGIIRWLGEPVGKICPGAHALEPRVSVLADEQLAGRMLGMVQRRLDLWLAQHVNKLLGPLVELEKGEGLDGTARGIAFRIAESLGVLDRARVSDEVKTLGQDARASLRKLGVRFGAYHLYLPSLLKPAPRALAAQLYALKHGGDTVRGLDDVLHLAASGRTSLAANQDVSKHLYRAAGFRVCGDRAVRVDILERLADLIRPAVNYRPGVSPGDPPPGAADGDGFIVTVAMTSLAGCSGVSFASILRALGYLPERRKGPAIATALPAAAGQPAAGDASPGRELGSTMNAAPEADAANASAEPPVAAGQPAEAVEAALPAPDGIPKSVSSGDVAQCADAPPEAMALSLSMELKQQGSRLSPDKNGAGNALTGVTDEELLIEIWRPHRLHHHARPKVGTSKRHSRGRERAPAGALREAPAETITQRPDAARTEAAIGPPGGGEALAAAIAGKQSAPNPSAVHDRRMDTSERGMSEPCNGARSPVRRQAGERNRCSIDERRERRGGRVETKETRQNERLPDPNSPFAKLLVLKARLEEKNNPES
jgi:ATP-dependent RNA helicase SUPV3L1/SUV3